MLGIFLLIIYSSMVYLSVNFLYYILKKKLKETNIICYSILFYKFNEIQAHLDADEYGRIRNMCLSCFCSILNSKRSLRDWVSHWQCLPSRET